MKETFTHDEVAMIFGVSRQTVYSWFGAGAISAEKVDGRLRERKDELEAIQRRYDFLRVYGKKTVEVTTQ